METFESPLGQSYKFTMSGLEDVTDWSKLTVTGASFTRRGNVLYLKGEELGEVTVSVTYGDSFSWNFILKTI